MRNVTTMLEREKKMLLIRQNDLEKQIVDAQAWEQEARRVLVDVSEQLANVERALAQVPA